MGGDGGDGGYVHGNHQAYYRDREPRTATSTFTQLLSSVTSVLLYVHRDYKDY